jgi:ribosomal protein S17E
MVRFPSKFNTSFDENKKSVDALTKGSTTRVRNQTAGYITRTLSLAQANSETESELEDQDEIAD